MLYAILLIVLAVLLFGSSKVLGAAGAVLGFIAGAAGLALASYSLVRMLELSAAQAIGGIVAVILGVLVVYGAVMEFRGIDPATGKKRR